MLSGLLSSTRTALARTTITAMQSRRALRTGATAAAAAAARAAPRVGRTTPAVPFLRQQQRPRDARLFASSMGQASLEEVEWDASNYNSVTLIGRLGREPEVKYLEDGKVTANVSLAVSRGKNQSAHWFELDFWEDEARLVADNLRKGQQIQVQGRLTQNTWRDKMTGDKREKIRVVVSKIALVAGGAAPRQGGGGYGSMDSYNGGGQTSFQSGGGRSSYGGGGGRASVASKDVEGRWAALFCSPNDFWDNRATKRNPKAPDFKHKETGEALWVESRGTPAWVASSLKELDMNKQVDLNSLFGANGGGGSDLQQQQQQQQRGSNEEIPF